MEKRSYSVKNKKAESSYKKLDLILNPKDIIKEENENIKGNLNDSQDEDSFDEESDFQNVSNYQFYFEVIISLVMCLNSFFTYSYLNIFHLVFCFIFIHSRINIEYNFWAKTKKTFMVILLSLDCLYLILKAIFFIIFALGNELSKSLEFLNPFFIVGYEWRNYYDFAIVFLIIVLITIYLFIAEFDKEFFEAIIKVKTSNFLEKEYINNKNILNFGFFYICLGAAVYPSAIDLIILILGFLYFVSLILSKKIRNVMEKYISILIMIIISIYTILNYSLNSKQIMNIINNKYNKYIFVDLFNNDGNEKSEFLIGNMISIGCFPFLLFMKGYNEIIFFSKCKSIDDIKKKEAIKNKFKEKKQYSFLSNNINDDFMKNERIFSLADSMNDKKKNKLQSIFNTNIDCGIIIFFKESSDVDLYTKIKMFLVKFCYTPAFCLHICRVSVILWINYYITYASIILIIWLFLSINFSGEEFFFIITKIIVFPLLIIIFVVSYISNIRGTSFDSQFLGLVYYENATKRFLHMTNKFLIITFFLMYIHLKSKHAKLLRNKEIREEIKIQQEELENVINHDLKGKYVTKPLEIFFKLYFLFLYLLLIISFYLSITQTINIMNQLGLIFLISMLILNNKYFKSYGIYICLIVINISFLAKYIVHFFYPKMNNINNMTKTELILSIIFHDYLYNIHFY